MDQETLTLDNLLVGEDTLAVEVTIGNSQDIKRGDVIVKTMVPAANTGTGAITVTAGTNFGHPNAAAEIFGIYMVAAEDVKTEAGTTAAILAYPKGEFNEAAMRFGGASDADDNRDVLASKGIILRKTVAA